ncbi:hypothetical protein QMK19_39530 [Streptomyces sp. H10-C2]|uniref:hypothetical protein n=1 Tax=unclassified Streptomyces TaxID=2593676 RepID=UPI0024BADD4D|nr:MULTISPECIES: hypothetical protein [unclassified Streptomyces]MDJ0347284.1 hypothetical protein [Streptomyces sp. PH10-H1]MDJ0375518.1 hypothetical protein [Streptomyces sp. H10-C2]
MANTRQFDRIIRDTKHKLKAVENHEMWALSAGDQAKLAGYGTLAFAKATRLKSSPMAERAFDRIWSEAAARLRAEVTAAETAKQQLLNEAAAAKVAKKSSGWW